eukprot:302826-Amphidinium_carterae.2
MYVYLSRQDTLEQYINAGNDVYYGTAGPGDAVVAPFNYVFAERVHDDIYGLRGVWFLLGDQEAHEEVNTWLIATKSPSKFLQQAMELILLIEGGEPSA